MNTLGGRAKGIGLLGFLLVGLGAYAAPISQVASIQSNGWVRIRGAADVHSLITLEASSNLIHWQSIATLSNRTGSKSNRSVKSRWSIKPIDWRVQYVLSFQTPATGVVRSANGAMDGTFTLR